MTRLTRWLRPSTTAYAHCDVPCGIYDPHQAELAARTVARMVELIGQLPKENPTEADRAKFVRCIAIKEQHAEIVKHEIQVIWSDYFKPEHLERYPDLHDRTWKILKLADKNKQNIDARRLPSLKPRSKSSPTSSGRQRSNVRSARRGYGRRRRRRQRLRRFCVRPAGAVRESVAARPLRRVACCRGRGEHGPRIGSRRLAAAGSNDPKLASAWQHRRISRAGQRHRGHQASGSWAPGSGPDPGRNPAPRPGRGLAARRQRRRSHRFAPLRPGHARRADWSRLVPLRADQANRADAGPTSRHTRPISSRAISSIMAWSRGSMSCSMIRSTPVAANRAAAARA